jgi:hypothetical protein
MAAIMRILDLTSAFQFFILKIPLWCMLNDIPTGKKRFFTVHSIDCVYNKKLISAGVIKYNEGRWNRKNFKGST